MVRVTPRLSSPHDLRHYRVRTSATDNRPTISCGLLETRQMKPKHAMFVGSAERYQLQLRIATSESRRRTLWDRSGAGRKFALREVLLEQLSRHTR